MPRYILPQPVSRRQSQTSHSQAITKLDVGTSAVHRPRKRSLSQFDRESEQYLNIFKGRLLGVEDGLLLAVDPRPQNWDHPQAHCDSGKDVDKFKGRLLGVEDGMIDAIVSEPCPGHRTRQEALDSSNNFPWYSQAKAKMPERQPRRLSRSTKRPSDAPALPRDRYAKPSAGSPAYEAPVSLSSNSDSLFNNHERRSVVDDSTAATPHFRPCAVSSHCDSVGSDNSKWNAQCSKRARKPMESQTATALYDNPSMPSVQASSSLTSESDLPEVTDTPREQDEIVVDSKMLERSNDGPLLGAWDLSNWQALEFTMSDLLVVRG